MATDDLDARLALDDAAGPARPLDPAASERLIDGALDAVLGPPPGGASSGGAITAAIVGAAIVLGIGAWWLTRGDDPPPPRSPDVPGVRVIAEAAVVVDAAPAAPAAAPEVAPPPTTPEPATKPKPKPAPGPAAAQPDDLLALANAARRRKAWREADDLYARVVADHPGTAAAQVAQVASGTLHLEHLGDPAGAARRLRAAIKTAPGPLAEEARYGLAEAYRALGDRDREAAALADFLDHHPDSPLAARARARRADLTP